MAADKKPFSLIGRTRSEKLRNLAGLLLIGGVLAYKFVDLKVERPLTIDIPVTDYGLATSADVQRAANGFQLAPQTLGELAQQTGRNAADIKANVTIHLLVGKNKPSLGVECESSWPTESVSMVCTRFAEELKAYLKEQPRAKAAS
ncbi:MAG: hypothetical protein RLZZ618_1451 [Pseudomonadota bacterium]|jgi:hypothetical protein